MLDRSMCCLFYAVRTEGDNSRLKYLIQASAYGKCIVADYNSVNKDKCVVEFLRLKNCYLVSIVDYRPQTSFLWMP